MFTPGRVGAVALAAVLLSGCGLANVWNEPVSRPPSIVPASPTSVEPVLDDRTLHPYDGTVTSAKCVTASALTWISSTRSARSVRPSATRSARG
ncbi:MAG: hypothetical protein J0I14_12400 [Propionibacteriaceae bacterium]|nr:hypothetical protein [Propionibacteriaceae bacterium]